MDRNLVGGVNRAIDIMSLSARRAWIEMQISVSTVVATLSLSARRAWIEMMLHAKNSNTHGSRSPQGERG